MAELDSPDTPDNANSVDEDRRKFLARCGKFAVVTPPAVTLLLSTSLHSSAIAHSGGRGYEWGGHRTDGRGGHRSSGWGGHRSAGHRG